MDTAISPAPVSGVNSPSSQAPQQPYGGMSQMGSGPAGVLYTLANELMSIYNEIEALYSQLSQLQTTVQATTTKTAADAQRSASNLQAFSIVAQAAGAFCSGVVTAVTMYAERQSSAKDMQELDTKQPQLNNLNQLQETTRAPAQDNIVIGDEGLPQTPGGDRARQLLEETYESPEGTNNREAYEVMRNPERTQYKKALQVKINALEKRINTLTTGIQTGQTRVNTAGQLVTSFVNTGAQGGQAYFTSLSGKGEAAKQVSTSVSQMAGSTAESTRQNIGKFYEMIAQLISAARQGSQTYAQT